MNCKNCHTENPEEAVYCMHCGTRLDGKVVCKQCGALNDGAALFCMHCGTRLSANAPSPACSSANVSADVPERGKAGKRPVGKYLSAAGEACLLAAALFALIFVFCIALTGSAVAQTGEVQRSTEAFWLYDYFGDIYKTISDTLSGVPKDSEPLAYSLYFPAALGTTVSAGALVAVPLLFAFACVRFVNRMRGKTEKSCFPLASACFSAYLFAAGAILALNQEAYRSAEASVSVTWNGATIAGVALVLCFFAVGTALLLAGKGKRLLCFSAIFKCGAALLSSALIAVALAFICRGQIALSSADASINVDVRFNAMLLSSYLGIAYIQDVTLPFPGTQLTAATVSLLVQIALIGLFFFTLRALWKSAVSEEKRTPVVLPAVCAALAVLGLAMNIVWMNAFFDYLGVTATQLDTIVISYAAPIVVTVMSVLLLAACIASRIVLRRSPQNTAAAATEPAPEPAPAPSEEFQEESFDGYGN